MVIYHPRWNEMNARWCISRRSSVCCIFLSKNVYIYILIRDRSNIGFNYMDVLKIANRIQRYGCSRFLLLLSPENYKRGGKEKIFERRNDIDSISEWYNLVQSRSINYFWTACIISGGASRGRLLQMRAQPGHTWRVVRNETSATHSFRKLCVRAASF